MVSIRPLIDYNFTQYGVHPWPIFALARYIYYRSGQGGGVISKIDGC